MWLVAVELTPHLTLWNDFRKRCFPSLRVPNYVQPFKGVQCDWPKQRKHKLKIGLALGPKPERLPVAGCSVNAIDSD